jgi:uncharacterized membrane protein
MILLLLLSILLGSFGLLTALNRWVVRGKLDAGLRGRISLALLFCFTGLGHFLMPEQMAQMLPPWVPARLAIIYVTGVLEIAGAIGLLVPRFSRLAGICLLVFLISVFPANIYAALHHVEMGGHESGPVYLLVRGPFQLLLIAWTTGSPSAA